MLDVEFPQLLQDMIGDLTSAPEPVVIKLFAQDPELLRQWAPQVGDAIKKIPGVVDVLDGIENTISGPAVIFNVDPVGRRRAPASPRRKWNWTPAPSCRASRRRRRWWSTTAPTPSACASPTRPAPPSDAIRNTLLVSGTGQDRHPRLAGQHASRSRARPRSAARTCSATSR